MYHIFEYEWLDDTKREKIISQIRNILNLDGLKIFARKCSIQQVSSKEARMFLEENHLQGHTGSSIKLGLFYNNELISIMTFGKPRFDKSCEYELIRYCCKKNTSVIGGASKLFKYFIENYNPKSIVSYSHIDKGRGKLYEKLGFELKHISAPDYAWIKEDDILSRYQCQKHKLLQQGFEGNSEKEIMESRGYFKAYNCGNKVWEWHLS